MEYTHLNLISTTKATDAPYWYSGAYYHLTN
jgi:hypothetical protein